MNPLSQLFRQHRRRLCATYLLFVTETLADLCQPLAMGLAVGSFLSGDPRGILIFALQQCAALGLGVVRRFWDAHFFNRVAAELGQDLVLTQRAAGVPVSAIAARANLANHLVDFFERDLPFLVHSVIQGFGTLIMLCIVAGTLVPASLALLIPAVILGTLYGRRSRRLTGRIHNELERTVGVVESAEPREVRDHFDGIADARRLLSRTEGIYFGAWQFISLAFIGSLFLLESRSRSAAEWTTILGYAHLLLTTLVNLPRVIDQLSRVQDVATRIRTSTDFPIIREGSGEVGLSSFRKR